MTIKVSENRLVGFREALADAFNVAELDELVSTALNRGLEDITTVDGLRSKAFYVVRWANDNGLLVNLFKRAIELNQDNPLIRERYDELQARVVQYPQATDLYEACVLRNGEYFVDRLKLRQTVRVDLSAQGGPRVLAVGGPPGSGKTYAVSFLQHVRDESALWVIHIDLEKYATEGTLDLPYICEKVARQIGLPVPENSEQLSRFSSFFGVQLIRYLETEKKECWIVFDSFNKEGVLIPQSIIEFILDLIGLSSQSTTRLRLVLLGLNRDDELMRKVRAKAVREDLGPIDDQSFVDFFVRLAEHLQQTRQITHDEQAVARAVANVTAAWNNDQPDAFKRQWDALIDEIEKLSQASSPMPGGINP